MTTVEIIIPVYNSLEYADLCIRSVLRYTISNDSIHTRITIADDCSDSYVACQLDKLAHGRDDCRVLHHVENLGFVKNCNTAMQQTDADIVVLLNSDTLVPPGFVEKIVACFESDPTIGIASPIASSSPFMSIPMLPGYNILSMARLIEAVSERRYPDIVTPEGFCYCIHRNVIEKQGYLDEIYGIGYCEESDYAMRALKNDFRTVCIDDLYIFHKRHGTFSKRYRDQQYLENRRIFDRRWQVAYKSAYLRHMRPNPITYLRRKIPDYQLPHGDYYENKKSASLHYRLWTIQYSFYEHGLKTTLRLIFSIIQKSIYHGLLLPDQWFRVFAEIYLKEGAKSAIAKSFLNIYNAVFQRVIFPYRIVRRLYHKRKKGGFSISSQVPQIVFVLPDIRMSGGVLSVVNLANELLMMGIQVRVVTLNANKGRAEGIYLFEPVHFRHMHDAIRYLPKADLYVATLWTTASYVSKLARRHHAMSAYFIQDHEVNFVRSKRLKQRVRGSYALIDHKFAKTQWLVDRMQEEGYDCHKIYPGMNLRIFYPAPHTSDGCVKVIAMNRKRTARRGSQTLIKALRIVKQKCPNTCIQLFGDDAGETDFNYKYLGRLSHKELSQYYRQSDIYVDASSVHGFGRPGAEALACGCALVTTDSGGVREYAVDGQNCLLARVGDPDDIAEKIKTLIQDEPLRKRLRQEGLQTVQSYAEWIPAKQFWEWAQSLINQETKNDEDAL